MGSVKEVRKAISELKSALETPDLKLILFMELKETRKQAEAEQYNQEVTPMSYTERAAALQRVVVKANLGEEFKEWSEQE